MTQAPALLVVGPLAAAMLAPVLSAYSPRAMRAALAAVLAAAVGLAALLLAVVLRTWPLPYHFGGWAPPWGIAYSLDPLNALMALLVAFFALAAFFGLREECEGWSRTRSGAFHALYLLLTAGLIGISLTGDLFNLYVFLEITALAGYALIAAGGERGIVAAFRYLLLGSVSATFWVLGLGYLYAVTGTLNLADMALRLKPVMGSPAVACGLAFIAAGLGIKMAVFPLHDWQPDAYSYAPPAIMPFVSAAMSKVAAYVLLRVLYTLFAASGPAASALPWLAWLSALTMLAGSLYALRQAELKRLLAYSSISQIGYVTLGFALGGDAGLTGGLLHLVNHAAAKSCLFAAAAGFGARAGSTRLGALAGLGRRMPWTSAAFTLAALSIIGLPPTAGFFSKLYLVTAAVQGGAWGLAAVLAASSLMAAVYMFRVIEQLYLRKPEREERQEAPAPFLGTALVLALLVLALGLGNQEVVLRVVGPAVEALQR